MASPFEPGLGWIPAAPSTTAADLMTPSEYHHLIGFLSKKFDGIDYRFDQNDARFARLEIGQEQLRDDLRAVAEGVTSNGERIDRLGERVDGVDGMVRELAGVEPVSD